MFIYLLLFPIVIYFFSLIFFLYGFPADDSPTMHTGLDFILIASLNFNASILISFHEINKY